MNTREKNVILQFYIALTVSEAGAVNWKFTRSRVYRKQGQARLHVVNTNSLHCKTHTIQT